MSFSRDLYREENIEKSLPLLAVTFSFEVPKPFPLTKNDAVEAELVELASLAAVAAGLDAVAVGSACVVATSHKTDAVAVALISFAAVAAVVAAAASTAAVAVVAAAVLVDAVVVAPSFAAGSTFVVAAESYIVAVAAVVDDVAAAVGYRPSWSRS